MTYSMSTAAARKASKKTQHVRSAGDWITLILLVAGALLVLFPLLVLTVNAFKTSADYNATGPLSLPKHFTMEGIISFWTTTNFPLKFWNSFIISLVVAVAAVVLSVLNSFALGIGKVKGNTWIVLGIMLANMMLRPIGAAIDARRTAQSHEAEGIRYTLEVKCLRKDEQAIRALVFNALHQPGFIVQSIAASDLPDDLVVITTVVATHMSSNIDIESSIETVTTPEVLGVKWDAEQITAVD